MRDAREQMTQSLVKAGAVSPDLLFDSAKATLQFDENGKLINGAALLEHLKKTLPEQFRTDKPQGSIDGGAGRARQYSIIAGQWPDFILQKEMPRS